jgi:hypothetical protein
VKGLVVDFDRKSDVVVVVVAHMGTLQDTTNSVASPNHKTTTSTYPEPYAAPPLALGHVLLRLESKRF